VKGVTIFFLFLLSGSVPKSFADLLESGNISDLLAVLLFLLLIKHCFNQLDTKNEAKRIFDLTLPKQANQLIPFLLGLALGTLRSTRYFQG
jgi:hypothetical protein